MKILRYTASLLIILSLVLSMCAFGSFANGAQYAKAADEAFAAGESGEMTIQEDGSLAQADYGEFAEAVNALFRFGILNKASFSAGAAVTRGDFVCAAMQLLGIENISSPRDTVFDDIKADNPASGAIAVAYDIGIVSGYGDNTFRADEALTLEQAVKILVSIVGYDVHAEANGGYPSGYLLVASKQGILKQIPEITEAFTWGVAAQLIYNTMYVDILQAQSYPAAKYHTVKGENVMTKYMGIYFYEGRVNANSITGITVPDGVKEGCVQIGDELFAENGTGVSDLIGCPIEAYYKLDDISKEKLLVCASIASQVSELSVRAEDIDAASDDTTLVYYADDNLSLKKASVSPSPLVVFNGKLFDVGAGSYPNAIPWPENGNVRLLNVDGNSGWDVIYIESFDIYVVEEASVASGLIRDLYKRSDLILDPSSSELHFTIEKYGEPLEFSEIKAGNVLSVMKSYDEKYIKVVVSSDRIKGVLSEISDDALSIDGVAYGIAKANKSHFAALKAGEKRYFYLTHDGLVAGFGDVMVSGEEYAYVYEGDYNKNGMDSGTTARFKFYMTDGTFRSLTTADNFKFNARKKDGAGNVLNGRYLIENMFTTYDSVVGKNVFKRQLVKISVNAEGLLTEIKTAYDNRVQAGGAGKGYNDFSIDYSFHTDIKDSTYSMDYSGRMYDAGVGGYWRCIDYKDMGILNGKYNTNDCVSVNIPSDDVFASYNKGIISLDDLEKQFSTFNLSSVWVNDELIYNVDLYDVDEERVIGVLLQWPYKTGSLVAATPASEDLFVVDKLVNAIDSEGCPSKRLYGLYKGKAVSHVIDENAVSFQLYANSKPFDLKRGDAIRIALSAGGEITNIIKVFTVDASASGADLYLLNGSELNEWQSASDPRRLGEDQGYPSVNKEIGANGGKESYVRATSPKWASYHRVVHAKYHNVVGDIGEVTFGSKQTGETPANKLLCAGSSLCRIYVYDEASDSVRIGSVDDIDPINIRQTAVIRVRHSMGYETLLVNRAKNPDTFYWTGAYND